MQQPEYPPMRRKDRAISNEEAWEVIKRNQCGVLCTVGEDGLPYGVPMSYASRNGLIYFHCARQGRKLRNLDAGNLVCFTIIDEHRPVYQKGHFSATYTSVIIQGRARLLDERGERDQAFYALVEELVPEHAEKTQSYIDKLDKVTAVIALEPLQVTGKARADQI